MNIVNPLNKAVVKTVVKDGKVICPGCSKETYSSDKILDVGMVDPEKWRQFEKDELCLRTSISNNARKGTGFKSL